MVRKIFFIVALMMSFGLLQPAVADQVANPSVTQSKQGTEATVNLNTASAAELAQALVGVGLKRAEQIIALREEIGRFTAVEQLLDVRGIGPKLLEKNAGKITF
ncbi:MAG: ComEA family DNA-binding protein [Idiomarina sp.]